MTDTGFDPHDPYIDGMMARRALTQGDAVHATMTAAGIVAHNNPVRMRAAARAADPTSILDNPDDHFAALRTAIGHLVDEWNDAAEHIRTVMGTVGQALDDIAAAINTTVGDPERHGHAATCPRHGPTRGGHCRRCRQ